MFRCIACRTEVTLDDVAVRLTENPADRRVLCTFCEHIDDRQPAHLRPALQADVAATARQA